MKKFTCAVISAAILTTALPRYMSNNAAAADDGMITYNYVYEEGGYNNSSNGHTRSMESLSRGLTAIKAENGVFLSWRLFDSEDNVFGSAESAVSFDVYRGNKLIATVSDSTNYLDTGGSVSDSYSVAPSGGERCDAVTPQRNSYFDIPIDIPADFVYNGASYAYAPSDASCGDLDGDGEYEIIVKWDANPQDNSNSGVTGNVYLDGVTPSVVTWRGYYDRTTAAAYTLENGRLKLSASFDTDDYDRQYIGQGNHNLTVADVDNDGCDEIICGALCLDNDFSVKWCSNRGHGDALHIGDYDPTHTGLEYFSVHESGSYGLTVYDADTGEELFHKDASKDTGRGMMADTGAGGYYQVNGGNQVQAYIAEGNGVFNASRYSFSNNFRIFWDGDLYDELLDGTSVASWNGSGMSSVFSAAGCVSVNGTKANPSLQADLFGDWREEVIYPLEDYSALRVYTTTDVTSYKLKTLMQDPVYRSGVAAEQTAYNQPPHVGFYIQALNDGITCLREDDGKVIAAFADDVENAVMIEAVYDDNGALILVNLFTDVSDGTAVDIGTREHNLKYMLFDSFEYMAPLCNSLVLERVVE